MIAMLAFSSHSLQQFVTGAFAWMVLVNRVFSLGKPEYPVNRPVRGLDPLPCRRRNIARLTLSAGGKHFKHECVRGRQDVGVQVNSGQVSVVAEVIRIALKTDPGKVSGDRAARLKCDGYVEQVRGSLFGEKSSGLTAGQVRRRETHAVVTAALRETQRQEN